MKNLKKKLPVLLISSALAFGLVGCDDGTSGTTATATANVGINGFITDGPVKQGIITIKNKAGAGKTIVDSRTNDDGTYTATIPSNGIAPFLLEITYDDSSIDLVTGLKPTIPLKTIISKNPGDINNDTVNVSAFTTMAINIAEQKGIDFTNATPDAITAGLSSAATTVKSSLGFGLPADYDIFASPITTNTAEFLKANEALSETIRRADTASTRKDITAIVKTLAADLTDGIIDGKKETTATATLDNTDAASFQVITAQVGTESLSNSLQITDEINADPKAPAVTLQAVLNTVAKNFFIKPSATAIDDVVITEQAKEQILVAIASSTALGANLSTLKTAVESLIIGKKSSATATALENTLTAVATQLKIATTNAQQPVEAEKAANAATSSSSFLLTSNNATFQDYNGTTALTDTILTGTTTNGVMTLNITPALNATNAALLSTGTGTAPTLTFPITTSGKSGTATLKLLVKDGSDTARTTGQRQIVVDLPVTWTANTASLTAKDAAGVTIAFVTGTDLSGSVTITNTSANILSFNSQQNQMELAITKLLGKVPQLTDMGVVDGSYFYQLDLGTLPLLDASTPSVKVSKIQGTFSIGQ